MSYEAAVGEAVRNLFASGLRTVGAVLLTAVLASLTMWYSWSDTSEVEDAWKAKIHAGAYTFSITSVDQTALGAARCDELRSVQGVLAAGGIISATDAFADASPNTPYTVIEATPGYLQIAFPIEPGVATASAVAGTSVSSQLGVHANSELSYNTPSTLERGVVSIDVPVISPARFELADGAIVIARAPTGVLNECLVEAIPGYEEAVSAAVDGWFPLHETRVKPILRDSELNRDVESDLRFRASQWLPLIVGLVFGSFTLLGWWARRLEFALYRMLGVNTSKILVMLVIETAIRLWIPVGIGSLLTLVCVFAGSLSMAICFCPVAASRNARWWP